MKRAILFLFLMAFVLGFSGCGEPTTPTNPNATSDWDQMRHDTSSNAVWNLPEVRPQEHFSPMGVRVYFNGNINPKQMQAIDEGISLMLSRCMRNQKNWTPSDAWRNFTRFTKHSDFRVILVESNYRSVEEPTRGCPLMITGAGGSFTTCGTISGVTYVNGTAVQRGGGYILVPYQDTDTEACWTLATNCMAYEPEHEFFINDTKLFNTYANDGYPTNGQGHPYCRGMN